MKEKIPKLLRDIQQILDQLIMEDEEELILNFDWIPNDSSDFDGNKKGLIHLANEIINLINDKSPENSKTLHLPQLFKKSFIKIVLKKRSQVK